MMTACVPVFTEIRKFLLFLLLIPAEVSAGLIGPSNYWECILIGMQEVKNDQVAQEVMKLCLSEFSAELSVSERREGAPGACVLKYGEDVSSALAAQQIQTACNLVYAQP